MQSQQVTSNSQIPNIALIYLIYLMQKLILCSLGLVNLDSCDRLAPKCSYESDHLVEATSDLLEGSVVKFGDKTSKVENIPWSKIHYASNTSSIIRRPKRSVPGLPPIITIGGDDNDCTRCEVVNTVCAIFNLGRNIKCVFFL